MKAALTLIDVFMQIEALYAEICFTNRDYTVRLHTGSAASRKGRILINTADLLFSEKI